MAHKEEPFYSTSDLAQKAQLLLYDEDSGKYYFAPFAEFLKLGNIPSDPAKESGKLTDLANRLAFLEFDDNFFKPDWGDDNADGVIYSPVATSGAIDTYSDVWSKIFPCGELAGTLEKMARGETASFSTLNATTTLTWQWQIRPKDGTWIDLHPAVTESPAAITTVERTRQGEKIPG